MSNKNSDRQTRTGTWVYTSTREQSRTSMKNVLDDAKVRTQEIKSTYTKSAKAS